MLKKIVLVAVAGLVVAAAAACGGGGDDNGNGNGTEPTSGPTSAATTEPTSAPTGGENGENGEGTVLTLVAKNTVFDKSELEAKAGKVTIVEDNQDAGVAHNLEVYKGSDENGELLGSTEIANGPTKHELTLTLEPGEYFYWCVVHPATMQGKLKVE